MLVARLFFLFLLVIPTSFSVFGQDTLFITTQKSGAVEDSNKVDVLLDFAKTFMGTPYRYAGSTPSGFDCSGFVFYVFEQMGMPAVRTSFGLSQLGQTIALSEVRPGDLLFFKGRNAANSTVGHVGIVSRIGEGEIIFIHSSTSRGVVEDNLIGSSYFMPRFIKAKRINTGE